MAAAATPASDLNAEPFRLAADFEPVRTIWLGFHSGHAALTTALVHALLPHVKVKMLVSGVEQKRVAADLFLSKGIALDDLEFFQEPLSNYFVRDTLIFAAGRIGSLGLLDAGWNYYGKPGWCLKRYPYSSDDARQCAATSINVRNELGTIIAKRTGAERLVTNLVMEGGGLEVNGQGLLIANQALVMQRNPGQSLKTLEQLHLSLPGVRKVIWLPHGLAEDPLLRSTIIGNYVAWGTGGHTDEFVRFADARTVLLAWPDPADAAYHPVARLNLQKMRVNFEILSRSKDVFGQTLKVIKVPMPRLIERPVFLSSTAREDWPDEWTADSFPPSERRRQGDRVIQIASASYLNFISANGVVVLPDYLPHGTKAATQNRVKQIFENIFKGREIRFVDSISANWVGGGPHCASAHEPF
jgi:agmatine deiminase